MCMFVGAIVMFFNSRYNWNAQGFDIGNTMLLIGITLFIMFSLVVIGKHGL